MLRKFNNECLPNDFSALCHLVCGV